MANIIYKYQITNYSQSVQSLTIAGQIFSFQPNSSQTIQISSKLSSLDTFFQLVQINDDNTTTVIQYANQQYITPVPATEASIQVLVTLIKQLLTTSTQELLQETLTATQTAALAAQSAASAAQSLNSGSNIIVADGANVAQGSKSDALWDGSSPTTIISILKYCGSKLAAGATFAAQTTQTTVLNTLATTLSSIYSSINNLLNVSVPFTPIATTTIALTVSTTVSTPLLLPQIQNASSYRIRNSLNSTGDVAWKLTVGNNNAVPVLPVPYATNGTGGSIGDKAINPGGVEIMGLDSTKQTALANGNLYLSAIATNGSTNVIYLSFGNGG